MASAVAICNMALAHIGSAAEVEAISPPDGSREAALCAQFYAQARTELLEPGGWQFALARATLAEVTNDSDAWSFAYALPSDCMTAKRVIGASLTTVYELGDADIMANPTWMDDNAGGDFQIEGTVLYTNVESAVLVYVRDITDTNKFTPSFTAALSYTLASYLAGPIVKGVEGTRVGDAMRQRAISYADSAATASANASLETREQTPSSIRARA
jgi:hypothetical protein